MEKTLNMDLMCNCMCLKKEKQGVCVYEIPLISCFASVF